MAPCEATAPVRVTDWPRGARNCEKSLVLIIQMRPVKPGLLRATATSESDLTDP